MTSSSTSSRFSGPFTKTVLCKGEGLVVEFRVKEARVHSVFASSKVDLSKQEDRLPLRFCVVSGEVIQAYPRMYETKNGLNAEIDYVDNHPKRKGYRQPAVLTIDQLATKIGGGNGALPKGFLDEQIKKLHPHVKNNFEFYVDSALPKAKDLAKGHELRLLTHGESVFVQRFSILNGKFNVFSQMGDKGAELSGGWSNQIMSYAEDSDQELEQNEQEGCDDDEWSD
eukprot:TRINITY_DN211_c0_g2_i1.p1 TRINITY_DN211_c0_g2~~TRINITY_DN211_c0_g2_i1.p1  ORF type:complete len:226 (+),score=45.83 TRINITY_DN211_c0_g2_i1:40-717(+)